jgi:hypothetical protein
MIISRCYPSASRSYSPTSAWHTSHTGSSPWRWLNYVSHQCCKWCFRSRKGKHVLVMHVLGYRESWDNKNVPSCFSKIQVPLYTTLVFVSLFIIHTTCFGLTYRPSSGVIYKQIRKGATDLNGSVDSKFL